MASGGGGTPPSPFPESVPEFKVKLPIPVPGRIGELSELTCNFVKFNERFYVADSHPMYAAEYNGLTDLGVMPFGVLSNAYSGTAEEGFPMAQMIRAVCLAVAQAYAFNWAYTQQRPPLPVPDNPGYGAPMSRAAVETQDGTIRLRGSCAALHSLDPALIATVNIGFAPIWGKEKPPA